MKLVFGINFIDNPVDGLPAYLGEFDKHYTDLLFINVIPAAPPGKACVEEKATPSGNKVIYVYIADFHDTGVPEMMRYKLLLEVAVKHMKAASVIMLNDWFAAPLLEYICYNAKVVYFIHLLYSDFSTKRVAGIYWERVGLQRADLVLANSYFIEQRVDTLFPEFFDKTTAVPLGVNKTIWKPSINLTSKKVLFFGRLDEQKNIKCFLTDFTEHEQAMKEAGLEFLVAGTGEARSAVAEAHFDKRLKFLGALKKEQLQEVLKDVKYCLFPSLYEPWGLALNEALACGKICIVEGVGGHLEQIVDGKNGFVVEPKNSLFRVLLSLEKNYGKKLKKVAENAVRSARDIEAHFEDLRRILP